jgi:death on curing protein
VVRVEDFFLAAESVLEIDTGRLMRVTKLPLVESALAAPFASFGGHDFYGHPIKRAAILASRIVRNHALPEGNKRVALLMMELYLREQGFELVAKITDIDRTFRELEAQRMTEDYFEVWLRAHTTPI